MNQVYFSGHQQDFAAVNNEIIHDLDVGIQCMKDIDGNGLCILNGQIHNKPLLEILAADFPRAKKTRSIKNKNNLEKLTK